MGFFRKIAGLFGLSRDEVIRDSEEDEEEEEENGNRASNDTAYQPSGLPRKGFSVPVQVAVDRPNFGPVIVSCGTGDGGVQGLRWCAKRLRIDEEGDVAHEFLNEVSTETSSGTTAEEHGRKQQQQQQLGPKFQVHYSTRPAKVKDQVVANHGKIQHCIEHQGRLTWV